MVYLISLGFFLPVFVLRSPYAAVGGMTIAHGLQYLLLLGLVAAGTAGRACGPGAAAGARPLANVALAGGAALNAASHLHGAAWAGRLAFGAYLGAVMAHFVIDAERVATAGPVSPGVPGRAGTGPAAARPGTGADRRPPIDRRPI